ncbi:uncharacterized protein LOC126965446 [Leptidea sinapis]|uniref:uncharacterized protein LOC126965446 n=1 Tax=Leptidea sinapis TaxID=189913 RepID=UPI0021C2C5E0|nr:uncharacterized protein LOC126965446 [Leptidea sinapis]
MAGGYEPAQYERDVVRLRIVRTQQNEQIMVLREEINKLKLKPLSYHPPLPSGSPPDSNRSQIYLFNIPHTRHFRKKYFPITPLGSQTKLVYDVNIMKLLYDCLDAMRVSRDDADELLRELTAELPDVISGAKTRYEIVDRIVRKWLLRYGGDPSLYKKQTRAFDALAALADRLIRQHVEAMEGTARQESSHVLESLEEALQDVSLDKKHLHERLAPCLAALLHSADVVDIATEETMTSLVKSLIDEDNPLTAASIDAIDVAEVIEDLKDCGVATARENLEFVVKTAIDCLRAQLVSADEAKYIEEEVTRALAADSKSLVSEMDPPKKYDEEQK